jgi:hypothetical protein
VKHPINFCGFRVKGVRCVIENVYRCQWIPTSLWIVTNCALRLGDWGALNLKPESAWQILLHGFWEFKF